MGAWLILWGRAGQTGTAAPGQRYRCEPRRLHRLRLSPRHSHSCTRGQRHACDLRHTHGHSPPRNMGLHVDTGIHSDMVLHPHAVTHTSPAAQAGSAVHLCTALHQSSTALWPQSPHRSGTAGHGYTYKKTTRVGHRPKPKTRHSLTPNLAMYNPSQETAPYTDGVNAQSPTQTQETATRDITILGPGPTRVAVDRPGHSQVQLHSDSSVRCPQEAPAHPGAAAWGPRFTETAESPNTDSGACAQAGCTHSGALGARGKRARTSKIPSAEHLRCGHTQKVMFAQQGTPKLKAA